MAFWTDRVVPRITDRALSSPEVMEMRTAVCAGLAGRVLEIGFGSGLNTGCYPETVTGVDVVEPSDLGWQMSARRRAGSPVMIERTGLDGQRLAAADGQYDAVLSTFTLCTIPDAARALTEVHRVLRPGGAFHFLEHGLAPDRGVARWQRRLDPVQRLVCGGCHLSRDVPALVAGAGLEVADVASSYLQGPGVARPWTYGYVGRAVRAA
jgi:SAM-dependent methyltransferase